MSKINELIQTLCPDGVEYKKLGEVATNMFRGNGIKRDEVTENGTPCVRYGEIYTTYDIWFDTCVSHTDVDRLKSPKYFGYGAVLIAITGESVLDIAKSTVYVGHERCLAGGDILVVEHEQNPKYMGYVLSTTDAQDQKSAGKIKSKVVHASAKDLAEITIPVPPLPVQDEIVRILDEYTELEAELEAKLSEEIELKQKQYEVYRDELLTFGDDVERKRLGDKSLFKISRGVVISKPYVKEHSGKYPVYSSQTENDGCLGCIDTYAVDGERVTWTTDGAKAGTVFYRNGKYNITNVCGMIECLNATKINCKYLSYVFSIVAPNYVNKGMGNPKLMSNIVELIDIPVPSPTEQQRIVKILDKYDTYTRDMISTLNTELESRKKQYAYYRDQLLTFKRKE